MAGRRRRSARRASSAPLLLAFVSGLAVGLSVALAVYLRTGPAAGGDEPAAASGDEGAATPRPRFDFYTILPEMEVKVPDWRLPRREATTGRPELAPGRYVIQVGSFRKFADADRVKAELALQGIEAGIERVVIEGQDVWYRVRVGPFTDPARLAAVRQQLSAAGMDHLVLRLKG